MFDNIAPAYDNLNHVLSWGIDKSWRRKAINCLKPYHPQRIMDVATGTGDFAIQAFTMLHPQELIGTDISEGMMNIGREKLSKPDSLNIYPLPRKIVLIFLLPTIALMP